MSAERFADLHTHSCVSDGSLTPRELVRTAREAGLDAIALTDHDTLEGLPEAKRAAGEFGIELISGVEFSCNVPYGECHILGCFLDEAHPELLETLSRLRRSRESRAEKMVGKLSDLGMPLTLEDLPRVEEKNSVLGRAHVAAALVQKEHVKNFDQAFERYLGQGKPAYIAQERLAPKEAIDLIHRAGGAAVLAHPATLENDNLIHEYAAQGLDGLECLYAVYDEVRRRRYQRLAEKKNLIVAGGSDFHGAIKPHIRLGAIKLPYENVLALFERAERNRS